MSGSVANLLSETYDHLGVFIGSFGTKFIATLLLIVMLRIAIAFVFKILRLNLDYKRTLKG